MNGNQERNESIRYAAGGPPVEGGPEQAGPPQPTPPATGGAPAAQASVAPSLAARPGADPRAKSPALACVLSAVPGLGQIYVGYYPRGFVHALVIAGLITLLASGELDELTPFAALFMVFFWLYNILDAGRRASFYNLALAGGEARDLPPEFPLPTFGGSIFGGLALIAVGFILLLHTRFDLSLDWVDEWWPMFPILLGVYLLGKALYDRSAAESR